MPTTFDGTAFEIHGAPDKPPLVLVHGLGLCRKLWEPFPHALSQNHQVITYDLYGHGESAPCPSSASLSLYANQIAILLDHLEIETAAIIGFSIGGMINRRFALDHPTRLKSLIILNSPHDRGEKAQELVEARALKVREEGPLATMDEALKRWFTPQHLENGSGPQVVRDWRTQVDPESYAQAAWVLANGVRELTGLPGSIKTPALVLTCENDSGSTPAMSEEIAKEIPGSELTIVPELKHLGLMEKPDLFIQPIRSFLDRTLETKCR